MKHLILFFATLFCGVSFSQNIEYKVYSMNDNEPVAEAEVCFSNEVDTFCFTSDAEGKIYIATPTQGVYTVKITKEGFESYQETVDLEDSLKIFYIWKSAFEIEPIVIDVRRDNISRSFGTTTLRVDESPIFKNASFEDVLRVIPEVSVGNDKVSVLGRSRVLYLINGRETTRNINQLQANQIDKVEVMSNPSSKYAANYDAVINIILKKNENLGLFLNVNSVAHFNKKNSFHNNIDLGLNFGKLSIESNFRYDFNNGLVYDNGWQEYHDKFEIYDKNYTSKSENLEVSTNVNYELNDQNDIGANFTYRRTPKNTAKYNTDSNFYDLDNNLNAVVHSVNEQHTDLDYMNLNLYHSLDKEKQSLSTYFSLISSENILNNDINSFNSNINTLNQNVLSHNKNTTYVINSDYGHDFEEDKLEFGVRFSKFDGLYSLQNQRFSNVVSDLLFDFNENIIASYLVYKFKRNRFDFSMGVRYEYFDKNVVFNNTERYNTNQGNFFPSLNVIYKPENQLHYMDFSYSKKIQRPSFSDITPFEYNVSYNTIFRGNPNLKNEIVHSLQMRYIYDRAFYVIPYYNYNANYIEQVSLFENNNIIWTAQNYDAYTYGANVGYNFSLFDKKLQLYNRVTLENVTNKGVIDNYELDKSLFQYSIYFAQAFKITDKTSVVLVSNYYSPQLSDFYEIKHGFRTDFRINSSFFDNKLEASMRINDVFNTYYNEIRGEVDGIRSYTYCDFSIRSLSLSLRYYFDTGKKVKSTPVDIDNSDEESRTSK
ncbi:MAG: outer membrane beta-barrel family protein [Bacteroidota bacterium]|nr:outer membrane beta-barrel family protein [Bacteroidota bacterium]